MSTMEANGTVIFEMMLRKVSRANRWRRSPDPADWVLSSSGCIGSAQASDTIAKSSER